MKAKGKALDTNNYLEFNYSCSTDMPCKKHQSSSSVGICPHCLRDRLMNLVCSECGEQRLCSCSCSDVSSSCTGEIGSVGRISFLIENEKERKNEGGRSDEVVLLRRSSSSCVEIKKSKNGFWKIKRLFVREKKKKGSEKYVGGDKKDGKRIVSRSRSLCSFRGGVGLNNDADEGSDNALQSAKISDVTGGILLDFESRKSGFRGFSDVDSEPRNSGSRYIFDSENKPRKSVFWGLFDAENEPRKSGFRGLYDSGFRGFGDSENGINSLKGARKMGGPGELNRVNSFPNRSIFPVKETEFSAVDGDDDDDPAFIDLKIDELSSSKSKRKFSFAERLMSTASCDHHDGNLRILRNEVTGSNRIVNSSSVGGSCRRIWSDEELKNVGRGSNNKGWKWIFLRQSSGRRSSSK